MADDEWDIRVTVYCNGRRVGTCDALGSSLADAAHAVDTNLDRRELDAVTRYGREVLKEATDDRG